MGITPAAWPRVGSRMWLARSSSEAVVTTPLGGCTCPPGYAAISTSRATAWVCVTPPPGAAIEPVTGRLVPAPQPACPPASTPMGAVCVLGTPPDAPAAPQTRRMANASEGAWMPLSVPMPVGSASALAIDEVSAAFSKALFGSPLGSSIVG